jgi:type I restriction enzyme, S subunit
MITLAQRMFVVRFKDLDLWQVPRAGLIPPTLPKGWRVARVGDFARQIAERVRVEPGNEYKMLGVKWYGEGVFLRETVKGDSISAAWVTPAKPGAFIYNRLFAWKESFAVVPPELSGCFVSGEFPQFTLDTSQVSAEYLDLVFRLQSVIRAVNAASAGSAAVSRNRFKEVEFLRMELPLPPLETQRAILAEWRKAKAKIAAAQERGTEIERQAESDFASALGVAAPRTNSTARYFVRRWREMDRWAVPYLANAAQVSVSLANVRYACIPLGDIAVISYGIQKCLQNRPGKFARPYLRVANVQRGQLDLREVKTIDVQDNEFKALRLQRGDLLVCEGNSADLVGRPAIWNGEIPDCVHQNHLLRVRVDHSRVEPTFLLHYMSTAPARAYFRARAKFTTNLASINSTDLRALPVPLPPLNVQRTLADHLASAYATAGRQRETARETAERIEADLEAWLLGTKEAPHA